MSPTRKQSPEEMLPLKPADFHILLVLSKEDLHGYGMMQQVEAESDGRVRLEVGSLYRLIARLTDAGLIVESGREKNYRRKYYRITKFGERVVRLEARRLVDVVSAARRYNLLGDGERS
jgi:DNA-binding PadR family transcriptional regulator